MRFSSLCVVIHNNMLEATNNLDKMSNVHYINIYYLFSYIIFIKFHKIANFKTSLLVTQKDYS
jgi:ascorbate-specific PTS system EIIC-type component UlaA